MTTPVGAVHDRVTSALPRVAVTPVGAGGTNMLRSSVSSPLPPPPPAAIVIVLLAVETVTFAPAAIVMPPVRALRADTPAGRRAASIVPDVIAAASCVCVADAAVMSATVGSLCT